MTDTLINPIYFDVETIAQLQDYFAADEAMKSVMLSNFFTKEAIQQLMNEIDEAEFIKDYEEMTHRRYKADVSNTIKRLLDSKDLASLVQQITGLSISSTDSNMYRFAHREYQIISDETILPEGLDLIFDLTPQWVEELGGIITYTDGEGQFYNLPPNFGSLTLVKRPDNYHYFVKYVNHYAEKLNRVVIISNTTVET